VPQQLNYQKLGLFMLKYLNLLPISVYFQHFCKVDTLNTLFRLGVIFAIFGFLWGVIKIGIQLILGNGSNQKWVPVSLKFLQYIFLVQTVIVLSLDGDSNFNLSKSPVFITSLILLIYFVSKAQQTKNKRSVFQMMNKGNINMNKVVDHKTELVLISVAALAYVLFLFQEKWAYNPISIWFRDSIISIEGAVFFGFIFKIIGFFFMLSIINKVFSSFAQIFNKTPENSISTDSEDPQDFDDFEDLSDNK
jgi:hypothetical protein